MKKAIIYKKEECVIIKPISINNNNYAFFVAVNSKKVLYLKESFVQGEQTYASLEKLVRLFPQYQSPSMFNIKVILDTFTNTVNYKISTGAISDSDELLEIISQFEKIINDPYIKKMTDVNATEIFSKQAMFEVTNTIKKLDGKYKKTNLSNLLHSNADSTNDVFLSQNWLDETVDNKQLVYESINKSKKAHRKSPIDFLFNNKVLNIYMIVMIVGIVGCLSCLKIINEWRTTGKEVEQDIEQLREEVLIVSESNSNSNGGNKSNSNSNNKSNTVKKYGNQYWEYINFDINKVDFNKLKKINSDSVAWIYVNNTNVNYPVVQTKDNSYYLNKDIYRKSNIAGWIFGDYRSDFKNFKKNTVIYGHGRTDKVMFGSLEDALSESWYKNKNNWIINLITPTNKTYWHIVSIYVIPQEAYYLSHNFENDALYQKWIDKMLSRSKYNFVKNSKTFNYGKNAPSTKDKFLTLSTCKDYKGNRIVVQAVLVGSEA